MTGPWQFSDAFLRKIPSESKAVLEARRGAWEAGVEDFYTRVERWFANFEDRDKELALKLFLRIDFYGPARFARCLRDLWQSIDRYLFETNKSAEDVRVVVPDMRGDSADRHAYEISKVWPITRRQIISTESLQRVDGECILVFFNDTHGTGNQFLREVFSAVPKDRFAAVFVVAVAIAERALARFERELPGVKVLPGRPAGSVFDELSAREVRRLQALGAKVYPRHPLGYGDAGLLTAYYFQCPNNTIPLVWADSTAGNNVVAGYSYPWVPLFPYRQKRSKGLREAAPVAQNRRVPPRSLLNGSWRWSRSEVALIVQRIESWGLLSERFFLHVGRWFGNFDVSEKSLALELFLATAYLDVAQVRAGIRQLRDGLLRDVLMAGGDIDDVVLVTTGDHKNTVYHYPYEFIREWRLNIDQVQSLSELTQDKVLDRTLVLFHHTRPSGDYLRRAHGVQLEQLRPRAVFIAGYAFPGAARAELAALCGNRSDRLLWLPAVSRVVGEVLSPRNRDELARIVREVSGVSSRRTDDDLLSAYYFQCPEASTPLLWWDEPAGRGRRKWTPLFRRVEVLQTERR